MSAISFYTRQQAAEFLNLSVSGIDYLRRVGRKNRDGSRRKLKPTSKGKYNPDDVRSFIKKTLN